MNPQLRVEEQVVDQAGAIRMTGPGTVDEMLFQTSEVTLQDDRLEASTTVHPDGCTHNTYRVGIVNN